MKGRENFSGGAKWEDVVGYSRMVQVGNMLFVSGTVAVDDEGTTIGPGDAYLQTKFILEKIGKYLALAGAGFENVVRTRMFVTNISDWEAIGKAHGAYFKDIKPATTMVEVKSLIQPEYLIEIEMEAVLG